MHDACTGTFTSGRAVVDKLRLMGFSHGLMNEPLRMDCRSCGKPMVMDTFEFACASCGAVHGVTPCHSYGAEFVQCAGPEY
jgi:predicted RNA-binding Zn-ribbon protein involved in translation (DUF1610 family)